MENLKRMSLWAFDYMEKIEPWSKARIQPQFNYDILLNNLWECFHSHILEARINVIITMNEMIII